MIRSTYTVFLYFLFISICNCLEAKRSGMDFSTGSGFLLNGIVFNSNNNGTTSTDLQTITSTSSQTNTTTSTSTATATATSTTTNTNTSTNSNTDTSTSTSTNTNTSTSTSTATSVPLSTTKELLSFSIQTPLTNGTISGNTISMTLPFGTNLTNLVAVFSHNGNSVRIGSTNQASGQTVNDFTNPVTYTVVAEDGSSQNYTISITVNGQVAGVIFSIGTGTYNQDQSISLSTTTPGASIYYYVGTTPATPDCTGANGTLFASNISITTTNTTIKAIACKSGFGNSAVNSATYTLKVALVNFSLLNTKIIVPALIQTSTSSPITITRCVAANSTPSCNGSGGCASGTPTELTYSSPGSATATFNLVGCKAGYLPSDLATVTVDIIGEKAADGLKIIHSADATMNGKYFALCAEGETYNSSTNTCSGPETTLRFCNDLTNVCNGGLSNTGTLTTGEVNNQCANKVQGALSNWRVPTVAELQFFWNNIYVNGSSAPTGRPTVNGLQYWSNASYTEITAWLVLSNGTAETSKNAYRAVRCIHD